MKKLILSLALLLAISPITASASLWNYYNGIGQSLPSLSERSVLYAELADDKYVGSVTQNNLLEDNLRAGLGTTFGAVTPIPRLIGNNTWTGTNTFSGTTTLGTTTLTSTTVSSLNIGSVSTASLVGGSSTTLHTHSKFLATASDTLQASANTERNKNNSDSYTKVKEIVLSVEGGTVRTYFECKGNVTTGNAKVYINDVAVGSEISCTTDSYVSSTADFSFNYGDKIQLYYKTFNLSSGVYARNFRLSFTTSSYDTLYNVITD